MFESWVSELLASYLGHFVDIQKEQLRVSLWSAWKSGVTLQNVKLKTEAFDYLQLPFDVKEGVVGRLQVQVPWHPFTGRLLQIALADVSVCIGPREEADWEEGPAGARAKAAERAELSALEVQQHSKPGSTADSSAATAGVSKGGGSAGGGSSNQSNRWGLWALCWQLGRIVLNRLQLTVTDVHLRFQEPASGSIQYGTQFGVRLQEMRTGKAEAAESPAGALDVQQQDVSIASFLVVSQLSCYWRPAGSGVQSETLPITVDARGPNAVLQPVDCSLSIRMHTMPGGASVVEASSMVRSVDVQLHQQQMADIARIADAAEVWKLRAKYAAIRPTGWRSAPNSKVPWRRVWRYAAKAVLMDKHLEGWPASIRNRDRLAQRRQYISLYQRKLQLARQQQASGQQLSASEQAQMKVESDALTTLEARFTPEDTKLFRMVAERTLPELPPHASQNEYATETSQRGWMQWGMSTAAGYLGYLPRQAPLSQALPKPPTEAEMQELLAAMQLDGPAPGSGNAADHVQDMRFTFHLTVHSTSLLLSETVTATKRLPFVRVETRGCETDLRMQPDKMAVDFIMASMTALDLCAHGPGIAEVIMTRGAAPEPAPASGFAQVEEVEAAAEEAPPILHLSYTAPLGQSQRAGANILVEVQPLLLTYQPQTLAALAAFTSGGPSDSHGSCVLAAINALDNPVARTLAKARKTWSAGPGNSLSIQVENVVVLAAGVSASADDPCAVLHTGRLEVSNVAAPSAAARSRALHWLLDKRTQVQDGVGMDAALRLDSIIDTLLTGRYRLRMDALAAGIAPSRRAAAGVCEWALQPVEAAVDLRLSRLGGDPRLIGIAADVRMGSIAVSLGPRTIAMLRTSLTFAQHHAPQHRQQQQHREADSTADSQRQPPPPDEQVPSAVLDMAAKGLDIRYDDDQPSFPDATNTHLRFSSGAATLRAQQLQGCKRMKVAAKNAVYSDASVHELSPPQIRGIVPRLGARISAQQLDIRIDDSSTTGLVFSFGLHALKGQGFSGETGNFVKPCQATKPAVLLVTVHKFHGGIHSAVTLQDGCFGTTTVMRIASMFVPHNIFMEKGPDGGRISREHPLELATLAKPTAPESPQQQSPREPLPAEMHRPHSAPALAQKTEEPALASPQGGGVEQSSSPSSTLLDGAGGKTGSEHADEQTDASTAASPVAGASGDSSTAAIAQPGSLDHAAAGPSADMQLSDSAPVAVQSPQLHVQTSAPEAASAPGVSPFAAVPAHGHTPEQDANATDGEPPPPLTPPHSPPRVSHSIERAAQSADEDSSHSPPAAAAVEAQSLQHWPDMADTAADTPHSMSAEGQASERVAAAEAGVPQEDAHPPPSQHPQGGHEQFSILVRNCRMLGPGLPHSLASRGGAAQEQVIRELMPQESNQDAAIRLDMPHLLLRLPIAAPPEHPDSHPAEEPASSWSDYARRPGGIFAHQPDIAEPPELPMTLCTASGVALYLAADGGDASNISRKLPVMLLPSLRLVTIEVREQPRDEGAAANAPRHQPAAFSLDVGAIEAALQPGQLHTALAAQAAAAQDWERICGGYAGHKQQDTTSSQLGGADLLSAASVDGSAASAPAAPEAPPSPVSGVSGRAFGELEAATACSESAASQEAPPSVASGSGGESPTAAQQVVDEAVGFSDSQRWTVTARMPSLVAHLYSPAHQSQPSVTLDVAGLAADYEHIGGLAAARHAAVRCAQLLLQLHDSLQESALQASFAAAAAMQAPASPRRAAGLATSKSAMPEDHAPMVHSSSSPSVAGLRRRRGSLAGSRKAGGGRRAGRLAQRSSARTTDLNAMASSGLHAALLPSRRGSSSDEDDVGPLQGFGSLSGVGYSSGGLGYGGFGSGLLHAQSSTINLSAGQEAGSDDFFDIEDDAASFFSATSNLLSTSGGGSELLRFADLPNSAETSTLDLLLITGHGGNSAPASAADAAGSRQSSTGAASSPRSGALATPESEGNQPAHGKPQPLALTFDGGLALPGSGLQLRRSRVVCAGLLLRAYTEGWGIAVACVQQYVAATEAAQPREPQQDATGAEATDSAAPVDVAAPALELDFSGWLLEVVATGGTGPATPAPALSLELAAAVALRGGQLASLHVPAAVVHAALAEPDFDITRCTTAEPLGALAGLAGLSIELADLAAGSALTASADRLSVWAHSRKLYTASAFAHILQTALAPQRVRDAQAPAAAADQKPLSVKVADLLRGLPPRAQFRLGRVAAYLADDSSDVETMLFEAALDELTVNVNGDASKDLREFSMQVTLRADVFNHGCMGWEPVVEPWAVAARLESTLPAQQPSSSSRAGHHDLSFTAAEVLEVTASLPAADALASTLDMLSGVQQLAAGELHLDDALARAPRPGLAQQCPYWVSNETGSAVTFWLAANAQDAPWSAPDDAFRVAPGQGLAMPVLSSSHDKPGPHLAGDPTTFTSAASPRNSTDSTASALAQSQLAQSQHVVERQLRRRGGRRQDGSQPRALLYFQLAGHEQPCGPIPLGALSTASQTVEVRPTGSTASAAAAWVRLVAAVQPRRHGGYTLQLHSGLRLHNATDMPLHIGWRSAQQETAIIEELDPDSSMWLPVMPITSGELTLRPAGNEDEELDHSWAEGIRLPPLLQALAPGSSTLATRQLLCPAIGTHSAVRFSLGAKLVSDGGGVELQIRPPVMLDNALPMPLGVTVWDDDALLTSAYVRPREQLSLHQVDPARLASLRLSLQPSGYESTQRFALPELPTAPTSSASPVGNALSAERSIQVREEAKARGTSVVTLRRTLEATSGCILLRFTCALWVYNCSGLPLALQKSEVEDVADYEALDIADAVPLQWLPPYEGAGGGHAVSAAAPVPSRAASMRSGSPTTTAVSETGSGTGTGSRGLRQVLPLPRGAGRLRPLEPLASPQRGMAESMDYMPAYRMPARWPSMVGTLSVQPDEPLRVQVRASPYKADAGASYWSEPLQLDALGAAAVVTVPAPLQGPAADAAAPNAAVVVSVTARQVAGGGGAVAVHVMPRYVLHNLLDVPLQCKQAGTAVERELAPGVPAALHWPDMKLPLALSLRVREAGWLWSGAIALDTPGDQFCKIRHRDRGVTMLVRVDISAGTNGVLSVALSHQAAGFAPYRIDNCTAATLHLRQARCSHASDVLRPYSALDYAWDEPGLPHTLLLELPGSRSLGAFNLDKVGTSTVVSLPGNARQGQPETPVQVAVRAEGPTRVMTVSDLTAHLALPLGPAVGAASAASGPSGGGGWEPWSGHDPVTVLTGPEAAMQRRNVLLGLLAEVRLEAAGIGISVVGPTQELLYASVNGVRMRGTASSGRLTLELALQGVQADNALPEAEHPVMLVLPRPPARWPAFKRVAQSVGSKGRKTAVTMRLAVWRRRPGGVLCIEELDLAMAPLALAVEQEHATGLVDFATAAAEPFRGPRPGDQRAAHEPALEALSGGMSRASASQQKVYIEHAVLSSIDASLSFLPAPWTASRSTGGRPLARMLGLAQVEGGRVQLAELTLRHPLLGGAALAQLVSRHYTRAALPQLFKLAASADVFGDPRRLLHHLGLGVWSFLAEPAAGLLRTTRGGGIRRLPEGVLAGTSALVGNTVFAFANASAKMLSTARQSLLVAGLDRPRLPAPAATGEMAAAAARERRLTVPPDNGQAGFMGALLNGVAGILSEPIRGVSEGGAGGLARGAVRGATGALVRPLAAALEASATFADNIRKAVGGGGGSAVRRRPPRWVDPVRPLQAYDWRQAAGRLLLRRLAGGAHEGEAFAGCVPLAPPGSFIVATCQHVLHVTADDGQAAPVLHWKAAAEDLVHVAREGAYVQLLAMAPQITHRLPASAAAAAAMSSKGPMSPFFPAILQCGDERDAAALEALLQNVRAQAVPRRMYVGHGLLISGATYC